jgi:3-methylcrotonyl-CoA carboxylase alpha subunit
MIAKVIVHADDRDTARTELAETCAGIEIWPVRTNAGFLHRALSHPTFAAGQVTTSFIGEQETALLDTSEVCATLVEDAAISLIAREINPIGSVDGSVRQELRFARPGDIWRQCIGFRLNAPDRAEMAFAADGVAQTVILPRNWMDRFTSSENVADGIVVFDEGEALHIRTRTTGVAAGAAVDGAILSPMPGRIIAVEVAAGETVTKGQKLLTVEAMKMEHSLVAPFDGTVTELIAETGRQVSEGTVLARIARAAFTGHLSALRAGE